MLENILPFSKTLHISPLFWVIFVDFKNDFLFIKIYIKHQNCEEHFLETKTNQISVYPKQFPEFT